MKSEEIFKELILFADFWGLGFHYNSGCGFSDGTGFFKDGHAVEIPHKTYYEALEIDLLNDFYEDCLFVKSSKLDDLEKLVKVIKMIKYDEFKELLSGIK